MTLGAQLIMHMVEKKDRERQLKLQEDQAELNKSLHTIQVFHAAGYKFADMTPEQLEPIFAPFEKVSGFQLPRDESGKILKPQPTFDDLVDKYASQALEPQMQGGPTNAPTNDGQPSTNGNTFGGLLSGKGLVESVLRKKFGLPSTFDEYKFDLDQAWRGAQLENQRAAIGQRQQGLNLQVAGLNQRGQAIASLDNYRKVLVGNQQKKAAFDSQVKLKGTKARLKLQTGIKINDAYQKFMEAYRYKKATPADLTQMNRMLEPYNTRLVEKPTGGAMGVTWGKQLVSEPIDPSKPERPIIDVPQEMLDMESMDDPTTTAPDYSLDEMDSIINSVGQ